MTIYALSSGSGISGIAVIRISGPGASNEFVAKPIIGDRKKMWNLFISKKKYGCYKGK